MFFLIFNRAVSKIPFRGLRYCDNIAIFAHDMGILYVVPTPVGNLEDITARALRILRECDLVLAEDTRTSGMLLHHFGIKKPMLSYHKFNEHQAVAGVVRRLEAGEVIALVSDAGTPGISDPGFLVVREAARAGADVVTLPGATAFVPALVTSGLPCDRFCFEGFLPQKKGRKSRLQSLKGETRTMVFYESPRRVVKTLEQFLEVFGGDRTCAVCREISKMHEECVRGTVSEVLEHFKAEEPRGEFVLLLSGAKEAACQEDGNGEREENAGQSPAERRPSKYRRKIMDNV